jgi:hypothetical protein
LQWWRKPQLQEELEELEEQVSILFDLMFLAWFYMIHVKGLVKDHSNSFSSQLLKVLCYLPKYPLFPLRGLFY